MFGYATFAQVTFAQAPDEDAGGAVTFTLSATDGADTASFSITVVPVVPPTPVAEQQTGGMGLDLSSQHRELLRWGVGRRRRHEDEREATEDIRWQIEKALDPKDKPDGMDPRVWALLQSARNPDQARYNALVKQIDQEDEDDIEAILALLP